MKNILQQIKDEILGTPIPTKKNLFYEIEDVPSLSKEDEDKRIQLIVEIMMSEPKVTIVDVDGLLREITLDELKNTGYEMLQFLRENQIKRIY